jgi:hypothetical protein
MRRFFERFGGGIAGVVAAQIGYAVAGTTGALLCIGGLIAGFVLAGWLAWSRLTR